MNKSRQVESRAALRASAGEIARQFSFFADQSLVQPVIVTKNGRERNVIISVERYAELLSNERRVFSAADAPDFLVDDIINSIAELKREIASK